MLVSMAGPYALDMGSITQTLANFGISKGEQMIYVAGLMQMIYKAEKNGKGTELDHEPVSGMDGK